MEQQIKSKPVDAGATPPPTNRPQTTRIANRPDGEARLRIVPLGGLGEIGKNMMALEYGNDTIVIDMGFRFPTAAQPGVDYMIPDVQYLEKQKGRIRGHILTHAHEDHMGGIPFILPKLPAPIYTARFSAGMVEKKLEEYRLQTQPQIRVIDPDKHERVQLGVFNVELVRVTHSIPDACAVVIRTPVGNIIHTGDWRLDPSPVDGKVMDLPRLTEVAAEGVLLLLSDSTSCERPGKTISERALEPNLTELFKRQRGRIIVSAISTNIHRMQTIIAAAQSSGRRLAFVGRSILGNVELAVKLGYIKVPSGMIMRVGEIVNQPDDQIVVICTGHQGEEKSQLNRMASGDQPNIKIKPGDAVILSSSIIPGNEEAIVDMVDGLMREGAKVYQDVFRHLDDIGPIHSGGHAPREDLATLMTLLKPKYFVPIHGEFHHMVRHAELAVQTGIPATQIFVMENGDVLEVNANSARKGQPVPAGQVMIDGMGIGDVEGMVLRDRLAMASEGIFVIVATVDRRTGQLLSSPDILSRGFVYMKESEELIGRARAQVRKAFERRSGGGQTDWTKFKMQLRDEIGDLLYKQTKRNPMILPVINEVDGGAKAQSQRPTAPTQSAPPSVRPAANPPYEPPLTRSVPDQHPRPERSF